DMSGSVANDPFKAYQEATKVMSLKKRSSSRTVSGDEVKITGSRRSLATALSNLNLKVFSQDGTVLPIEDPTEVFD
ncbi:hypothetical protein HID58_007971, partial [Brassica napus]